MNLSFQSLEININLDLVQEVCVEFDKSMQITFTNL